VSFTAAITGERRVVRRRPVVLAALTRDSDVR
jgi:hypothetical protein